MAARLLNARARSRLLLTCEHASAHVPSPYADLGLDRATLLDHIGWDIGAAWVTEELSARLDASAVLSAASRLLVDCNRAVSDHDLMPSVSHGVAIPGNAAIDDAERERRLDAFYRPYHQAIDAAVAERDIALLLSVHSFTPTPLGGRARDFDVGILHDDFSDLAGRLAGLVAGQGFAVRMNEPYSALDGLIFSARDHGLRGGITYLEIEVNNRLIASEASASVVAGRLAAALGGFLKETQCE